MDLQAEINKRKTFAIISHPDAGKTTLTEKFLLFGGGERHGRRLLEAGDTGHVRAPPRLQLRDPRGNADCPVARVRQRPAGPGHRRR